ncbi:dihydrofolate reductase [Deinococcus metalli]|uniref:Deaminase reductase n=1 Tax=Deinococcus metalli TaxID=1141878 RepID=A0A7W8KFJ9_9DEIO|nr:dihydrofolate reductase family protein [Deinococcus metalli]MBB5376995.1 dihydrofolate reductase [Deinococcus metalli]GHF46908.1 deaminase reductase [Deinococcus metalli]
MRRVIANLDSTVDGVTEQPAAWMRPRQADADARVQAMMRGTDALLLGRVTYDHLAAYWPAQPRGASWIADFVNGTPRAVVSRTLRDPAWPGTTVLPDLDGVADLRAQGQGHLVVLGSMTLLDALARAHLIDEYHLWLHPVLLGGARPVFPPGLNQSLTLLEAQPFTGGLLLLRYAPHGGTA